MSETETKRYLAIFNLRDDTPIAEIGKIYPGIDGRLRRFSNGEMEVAFRSVEGQTFGLFFKTSLPIDIIRAELDGGTRHGDAFLILEAGDVACHKAMGRAATWLQRH